MCEQSFRQPVRVFRVDRGALKKRYFVFVRNFFAVYNYDKCMQNIFPFTDFKYVLVICNILISLNMDLIVLVIFLYFIRDRSSACPLLGFFTGGLSEQYGRYGRVFLLNLIKV